MPPVAIVMNMFYTGLGIARSLGEHGIPVIGLSSHRGIYGNFTRYATVHRCPDSREQPEALATYLMRMGAELGSRAIIFPTRDDDIVFLDRFRGELSKRFNMVIPDSSAVEASLDKWETYLSAKRAQVATPKCWLVEDEQDLRRFAPELTYPCVMKPVASRDWRRGGNWEIVGGRKVIGVSSWDQLKAEYTAVASADRRVLLQEMIPGGDDCLVIAACYLDRQSNLVAGFNTQKLVQSPDGFGTGCIVQTVDRPELFDPTIRLLQAMRFSGIAEVEYKWDARNRIFQLIEINPRPWDQHRLGKACGTDLVYLAYCDHAGLPIPTAKRHVSSQKWIAEDAFLMEALRLLRMRDPALRSFLRQAHGKRSYAIWSVKDPLPFLGFMAARFLPMLARAASRLLLSALKEKMPGKVFLRKKGWTYESYLEKRKSHS